MPWHFRGSPHYLNQRVKDLGLPQAIADRSRANTEIFKVQVLLSQLCERYHKARKEDGRPVFHPPEMAQIVACLAQAEQEVAKLHLLASTAAAMLDEARQAFSLAPHKRSFEILSDYEPPPTLPTGNGTVGISDPRLVTVESG